jgi:hypothetical protein
MLVPDSLLVRAGRLNGRLATYRYLRVAFDIVLCCMSECVGVGVCLEREGVGSYATISDSSSYHVPFHVSLHCQSYARWLPGGGLIGASGRSRASGITSKL